MENAIIIRGHFEKPNQIVLDEKVENMEGDIELIIRKLTKTKNPRKSGSLKGLIHISKDFDAPLSDFEDYM